MSGGAGGTADPAPFLSVVIPYYRGADSIAAAVRSVLDQTRQPGEIVICDDGSPDDLTAALGGLGDSVRIVRKENGGISSAMNALTAAARGEFLVQLDQDDVFEPTRLEAIAAALAARPDADIVATDAIVEFEGRAVARLGEIHPFVAEDQRLAILSNLFFLWPVVRRTLLERIGGYDESFPVMQDWECFIRLMLADANLAYVDEPLYRWRLTPGSRSSADGIENATALVRMTEKTLSAPLDDREREAAGSALVAHRRRLVLERARFAIETAAPDARRRSLAIARDPGFGSSTRLKLAIAGASPWLVRRLIAWRENQDPAAVALARRGLRSFA